MIKKNWSILLITSIVILLPILAGLFLWNQLPEQLPMHWDANGQVDGWGSKTFVVVGMPLIMLAFQWVCVLATMADPKQKDHSEKVLQLVFWIIPLLTLVLFAITFAVGLGKQVPVEVILTLFLGFLFTVIGNYMPKCKQNYTIGIKIPWTLNSEQNWNKTHRFAGVTWTIGGIIIMLSGFVGGIWLLMAITLLMAIVPVVYSFILYRKGI